MKLSYFVKDLPLKHTFTIAHQSRDIQDTVIVKLKNEAYYGLGETTTNPFYGMTAENIIGTLELAIQKVESENWKSPEELWELCKGDFSQNPFAQCALDMAAWDIFTKMKGKKLYEYLGLDPKAIPLTNFTIGIDTIEKMVEKMKEVDWPIYKIKLGTEHDLDIIRELRKHTDAVFRIDANCAWTADQAIIYSEELLKLNVEFMEQPLAKDDLEGMKEVFKNSKLPVIADESCIVESDVKKCSGLFHGINIKLVKAGGITPALRMIKEAKSLGMKCMVGCMTESSVGITAIAHIAPLLDYVDMDGAMLLSKDIARGVVITPEKVTFPEGNGIGAELV
ncbi:Muconate cycloisomerase [Indibacter alkaliphilus LW1]|jgi:L-alanine-DL-glutamate epimerase-like enolase superfamily enzyme|uniref:Dipeptide epimerase n=1 Tax=Indibacter alkaliphilus (strain CCUG 57479 / KCTC 22604 / LW1) TaxID=1189612 RepID=S2DQ70_INDAL|nr:dipeptide epimerase [Indibacter alkaliphilus]EOZ91973.1 Muconate cycloisomerase [Indibacter alkaliphilus LW1]